MAEPEADRPDGPIAPGVEAEDREPGRWPVSPRVAVAATVLIIAVAGLSIGKASSTNEPQPAEAREQAELPAREAAIEQARRITALQGYREGRRLGRQEGTRSGTRAGAADGKVRVQLEAAEAAEAEAAAAQAELSEISAPPPAPRR